MFTRFTGRARHVMTLANQEAQRFNHEYIGTEHILLAIIVEGHGVAAQILQRLRIDAEAVRREAEKLVQSGLEVKESFRTGGRSLAARAPRRRFRNSTCDRHSP